MKSVVFFLLIGVSSLKVVTTYPYIADIVKKIGGSKVSVFAMAKGNEDPHFIVPRPSFIARVRRADLLIINGASLEIGFAPVIVQRAGNPQVKPGASGFLDLSQVVELIEKPQTVSRAEGDVHPEGNPHFWLDPRNIPLLAEAIKEKLCVLDPQGCETYRRNTTQFVTRWREHLSRWSRLMKPLRGARVIQYHPLFDYFIRAYDLKDEGTLEPKPGIPPTAKHINFLLSRVKTADFVFLDVYHERRTAKFVAEKLGARLVVLPHDVGSLPEVKSLKDLFDTIVKRLTGGDVQ